MCNKVLFQLKHQISTFQSYYFFIRISSKDLIRVNTMVQLDPISDKFFI